MAEMREIDIGWDKKKKREVIGLPDYGLLVKLFL